MTTQSPIEQRIIDAEMYWDNLAKDWFRLVHRATHNVIGHYRHDWSSLFPDRQYVATILNYENPDAPSLHKETKSFATAEDARYWIEKYAARG